MKRKRLILEMAGAFALLIFNMNVLGQDPSLLPKSKAFFDSLDNRIETLQHQIPRLKQSHDISLFNVQRDLELSLFVKAYEEYVVQEDLFPAKDMVETRIERARLRKDQYSVDFYNNYKDKVYNQIKYQRMYYQALFEKEKNFRKEFFAIARAGTVEAYQRAQHMTDLALKYAEENNFTETAKGLKNYRMYCDARIFDIQSPYNLEELTLSEKDFEKVFIPLIESDSIASIKEAEKLVGYCMQYSEFMNTALKTDYFEQQKLAVATALTDLLDRQKSEANQGKMSDQSVIARLDSLNPRGVYKWHEYIIVISEFIPASGFESVKKGEAIINADNVLASYLKKNKLCKSTEDLKYGYSYIIPYKSDNQASAFMYYPEVQQWQYIACYTLVNNPGYTREIARYMQPVIFREEDQTKTDGK